jgi:hypothetical protein
VPDKLKSCPKCGHDISPKAYTCPGCGHPLKKSPGARFAQAGCGLLMIIVGGLILLGIAAIAMHGG